MMLQAHILKNKELNPATGISRVEYWCGLVSEATAIIGNETSDIAHVDCEKCKEEERKSNG